MVDGGVIEPSLRERKKRATRNGLTAAALRLAVERGADAVTVDDIAAAADVSVRTFFNYFATKEEAFVADDLERGRAFLTRLGAAPDDEAVWPLLWSTARECLVTSDLPGREQALKEMLVRSSPAIAAHVLEAFGRLEQELVIELTRRCALLEGEQADPLRPRLLANCTVAAVRAAAETWLAGAPGDESAGTSPAYVDLLDRAFEALTPAFA